MINSGIKISHVTIASWTNKFAPFFKQKADKFKANLNLQSDDWHADETWDILIPELIIKN